MPFALAHGEYLAGRLLDLDLSGSIGAVFLSVTYCCLLFPTEYQAGGPMSLSMGFYGKPVLLVVLFESFPSRFLLVGFSLPIVVVSFYMGDLC